MAQLKINRHWVRPKWSDVIPEGEVLSQYNYEKALGAKHIVTTGRIGRGTKIHRLTLVVVETSEGLAILDMYVFCGSRKWGRAGQSYLRPFFDDNMALITCEKCLGH